MQNKYQQINFKQGKNIFLKVFNQLLLTLGLIITVCNADFI